MAGWHILAMLIDGRSHCLSSLFFALHTEKKSRIKNEDGEDDDKDEEEEEGEEDEDEEGDEEGEGENGNNLLLFSSLSVGACTHRHTLSFP